MENATSPRENAHRRSADLPRKRLSPELIAEFRERVAEGTYDLPAIRHTVAACLLESGDI